MSKWEGRVSIAVSVALLVVVLAVRMSNPELTETQLFFAFWWLWLAIVGVALVTLYLVRERQE